MFAPPGIDPDSESEEDQSPTSTIKESPSRPQFSIKAIFRPDYPSKKPETPKPTTSVETDRIDNEENKKKISTAAKIKKKVRIFAHDEPIPQEVFNIESPTEEISSSPVLPQLEEPLPSSTALSPLTQNVAVDNDQVRSEVLKLLQELIAQNRTPSNPPPNLEPAPESTPSEHIPAATIAQNPASNVTSPIQAPSVPTTVLDTPVQAPPLSNAGPPASSLNVALGGPHCPIDGVHTHHGLNESYYNPQPPAPQPDNPPVDYQSPPSDTYPPSQPIYKPQPGRPSSPHLSQPPHHPYSPQQSFTPWPTAHPAPVWTSYYNHPPPFYPQQNFPTPQPYSPPSSGNNWTSGPPPPNYPHPQVLQPWQPYYPVPHAGYPPPPGQGYPSAQGGGPRGETVGEGSPWSPLVNPWPADGRTGQPSSSNHPDSYQNGSTVSPQLDADGLRLKPPSVEGKMASPTRPEKRPTSSQGEVGTVASSSTGQEPQRFRPNKNEHSSGPVARPVRPEKVNSDGVNGRTSGLVVANPDPDQHDGRSSTALKQSGIPKADQLQSGQELTWSKCVVSVAACIDLANGVLSSLQKAGNSSSTVLEHILPRLIGSLMSQKDLVTSMSEVFGSEHSQTMSEFSGHLSIIQRYLTAQKVSSDGSNKEGNELGLERIANDTDTSFHAGTIQALLSHLLGLSEYFTPSMMKALKGLMAEWAKDGLNIKSIVHTVMTVQHELKVAQKARLADGQDKKEIFKKSGGLMSLLEKMQAMLSRAHRASSRGAPSSIFSSATPKVSDKEHRSSRAIRSAVSDAEHGRVADTSAKKALTAKKDPARLGKPDRREAVSDKPHQPSPPDQLTASKAVETRRKRSSEEISHLEIARKKAILLERAKQKLKEKAAVADQTGARRSASDPRSSYPESRSEAPEVREKPVTGDRHTRDPSEKVEATAEELTKRLEKVKEHSPSRRTRQTSERSKHRPIETPQIHLPEASQNFMDGREVSVPTDAVPATSMPAHSEDQSGTPSSEASPTAPISPEQQFKPDSNQSTEIASEIHFPSPPPTMTRSKIRRSKFDIHDSSDSAYSSATDESDHEAEELLKQADSGPMPVHGDLHAVNEEEEKPSEDQVRRAAEVLGVDQPETQHRKGVRVIHRLEDKQ